MRQDGPRRFYRADRAALGPLAALLEQMWAGQLDRLAGLAEAEAEGPAAKRRTGEPAEGGG